MLRLTRTGTVTMIQGGNDLLLAIEGAGDRTRPILSPRHSWSANGDHCARTITRPLPARNTRVLDHTRPVSMLAAILLASTSLHITVWPNGQGHAPVRTYTLTCAPLGGTLPQRALACQKLVQLKAPFVPVPAGTPCTQIYGGPQEARVTGRFRGSRVYAHFDRNGGCEIARWNRVGFLFPAA